MYKFLSVLVLVLSSHFTNAQTYCFQSEDDVMTYVIGKTFESKDGQVSIKFNSSEAILKAGENNLTYMYDESKYNQGAGSDLDKVEMEDEEIVQNVQKGIRSRFYTKGRYSVSREKGTHHFHRLLASFIENT